MTYNNVGQLLSRTGPRADVPNTEYWAYSAGNLVSHVDAVGLTTSYGGFDAEGRPSTVAYPDGTTAIITYDLRGRVTSHTRAGNVSRWVYDAAGLLVSATTVDGEVLSFTYDAAQRVTVISDARGNNVSYALDAAGNVVTESTTNATNVLTETRSRVYDLLNRIKAATGAN